MRITLMGMGLLTIILTLAVLAQETSPPAGVSAAAPQPSAASSPQPLGPERIRGTLVNHGGPMSRFFQAGYFLVTLDRYSPEEETKALLTALRSGGQEALLEGLWKLKPIGYLKVGGSMGFPLVVARSRPIPDGGRVIRILTNRPIAPAEFNSMSRSTQYPFGFIEIFMPPEGKGYGTLIPTAQVELGPSGQVTVESLGTMPYQLVDVTIEPAPKKRT